MTIPYTPCVPRSPAPSDCQSRCSVLSEDPPPEAGSSPGPCPDYIFSIKGLTPVLSLRWSSWTMRKGTASLHTTSSMRHRFGCTCTVAAVASQRERRRADDFVVKRHRSNGEEYIVDRATGKITYAACCITCHGTTATTTTTSNINGTRFRAILFSL